MIKGIRIFTGEHILESGNVLVEEGIIQYVGNETLDTDVQIVSGSGSTLIPGLIEAHMHATKDLALP